MEDFIVWQRAVLCRHCLWDVDKVQFRCRSCSNSLGLERHIFKPNYIVLHNCSVKLCFEHQSTLSGVCFSCRCAYFVMIVMPLPTAFTSEKQHVLHQGCMSLPNMFRFYMDFTKWYPASKLTSLWSKKWVLLIWKSHCQKGCGAFSLGAFMTIHDHFTCRCMCCGYHWHYHFGCLSFVYLDFPHSANSSASWISGERRCRGGICCARPPCCTLDAADLRMSTMSNSHPKGFEYVWIWNCTSLRCVVSDRVYGLFLDSFSTFGDLPLKPVFSNCFRMSRTVEPFKCTNIKCRCKICPRMICKTWPFHRSPLCQMTSACMMSLLLSMRRGIKVFHVESPAWVGSKTFSISLYIYIYIHTKCIYNIILYTSSTAQGGGGSFKNRKPIGEVGCCESGMAERSHWWTERCLRSPLFLSLSLSFSRFLSLSLYLSSV